MSSSHAESLGNGFRKYIQEKKLAAQEMWTSRLHNVDSILMAYIAGLYAGEGTHYNETEVELVNSKKEIIKPFLLFLKEIGAKWTTTLAIHTTQNKDACVDFWSDTISDITYVRQIDTRPQKKNNANRRYYGTIKVRVIKADGLRKAMAEVSGLFV